MMVTLLPSSLGLRPAPASVGGDASCGLLGAPKRSFTSTWRPASTAAVGAVAPASVGNIPASPLAGTLAPATGHIPESPLVGTLAPASAGNIPASPLAGTLAPMALETPPSVVKEKSAELLAEVPVSATKGMPASVIAGAAESTMTGSCTTLLFVRTERFGRPRPLSGAAYETPTQSAKATRRNLRTCCEMAFIIVTQE